jgi:hypothetical protein
VVHDAKAQLARLVVGQLSETDRHCDPST